MLLTRTRCVRLVLVAAVLGLGAGLTPPAAPASAAPALASGASAGEACPRQMLGAPAGTRRAGIADADPTGRFQAGYVEDASFISRLALWTDGVAQPQTLGAEHPGVTGVNSHGDMVGSDFFPEGGGRGWSYRNGEFNTLPGLSAGASGFPAAVNAEGTAAGSSLDGGAFLPVLWAPDGAVRQLALPEGDTRGQAQDIDDDGTVVGWASTDAGVTHAVRWLPDGSVERLPGTPPQDGSRATAVRGGNVIGQVIPDTGDSSMLLWRWDTASPQAFTGTPQAVNARGAVVELTSYYVKLQLTEPDGTVRSLPTDTTPYPTGHVVALTDAGVAYGNWNSTPVKWDCRPAALAER
ncbi:hypothetical protein [Streptomyces longispororuber]|uniref:hypothetical protein n=1 Tax=Streptomyces longispororuber TaxID=68230 RepID=UPI00210A4CF5|nr:hypothetical protein [Streptomyces longispororuber]MCQ4205669.1 hypothetical protein [Streptomyces longispororuber]